MLLSVLIVRSASRAHKNLSSRLLYGCETLIAIRCLKLRRLISFQVGVSLVRRPTNEASVKIGKADCPAALSGTLPRKCFVKLVDNVIQRRAQVEKAVSDSASERLSIANLERWRVSDVEAIFESFSVTLRGDGIEVAPTFAGEFTFFEVERYLVFPSSRQLSRRTAQCRLGFNHGPTFPRLSAYRQGGAEFRQTY